MQYKDGNTPKRGDIVIGTNTKGVRVVAQVVATGLNPKKPELGDLRLQGFSGVGEFPDKYSEYLDIAAGCVKGFDNVEQKYFVGKAEPMFGDAKDFSLIIV